MQDLFAANEEDAALEAFLKGVNKEVASHLKEMENINQTLQATPDAVLPSGKAMLDLLG